MHHPSASLTSFPSLQLASDLIKPSQAHHKGRKGYIGEIYSASLKLCHLIQYLLTLISSFVTQLRSTVIKLSACPGLRYFLLICTIPLPSLD